MKKLIKAMLPKSAWDRARATRDWMQLATLGREDFALSNLRSAAQLSFSAIFADEQISAFWVQDGAMIGRVYGAEDESGGVNPGDRRALYYLTIALKPRRVLEVGTHVGASTLHIAMALKRLNQDGKVTTVDIADVNHPETGAWKELQLKKSPREFARELGCLEQIEFRTGACLTVMQATKERYDFVFLDGDHRALAVYQEISAALPLLNPGGVILLHDYCPGGKALYQNDAVLLGPFYAIERVRKENGGLRVLPLGNLPWLTKQGKKVTSLAAIARDGDERSFPGGSEAPDTRKNRSETVEAC
jgi:predicted O-methyltransferase YrrM